MIEEKAVEPPKLLLDSLEIQNFRAFRHLRIEQLGRVNLITGKNNVGKSSLLEALRVYATGGRPSVLRELLASRDELETGASYSKETVVALRKLFYGRPELNQEPPLFSIGSAELESSRLSVKISWSAPPRPPMVVTPHTRQSVGTSVVNTPSLVIVQGTFEPDPIPLHQIFDDAALMLAEYPYPKAGSIEYVSANGSNLAHLAELWTETALTPLEDDVVLALQLVAPEVFRVGIIGSDEHPVPVVTYGANRNRITLKSLGDGMNRLFGLSLSFVNAAGGFLLVDEIENGLHYSVLPDVWKLIFETARRLNVQVFATTHSWDCIEAFQQAAAKDQNEEAMLIRLQNSKDGIKAVLYDERLLGIATREQIEVR